MEGKPHLEASTVACRRFLNPSTLLKLQYKDEEFIAMNVHLRPQQPGDEDFVYRLYTSTRAQEFAQVPWNEAQKDAFFRMQFLAQSRWYETAYTGAEHQLILRDEQPVGRIIVLRSPRELRLVDIALLPEHRNCGIGTALMNGLLAESRQSGMPVELQVLKGNPALHLYERLGFTRTGEDEMYYRMHWNSA